MSISTDTDGSSTEDTSTLSRELGSEEETTSEDKLTSEDRELSLLEEEESSPPSEEDTLSTSEFSDRR